MVNCSHCGTLFEPAYASSGLYCSNKCQQDKATDKRIAQWLAGNDIGYTGAKKQLKNFIKRYLLQKANYACEECRWDKKHPDDGRPLVEVHHIDGDAGNNKPENLKVLCPNCHSMTSTFKRRNSNATR
jgi:hypothetical protein